MSDDDVYDLYVAASEVVASARQFSTKAPRLPADGEVIISLRSFQLIAFATRDEQKRRIAEKS